MKYIERDISDRLKEQSDIFPLIFLAGPQQSGKSALLRKIFQKNYIYSSLEDNDTKNYAMNDPVGFLNSFKNDRVIIDEVHRSPSLIPFIRNKIDEKTSKKFFILSGCLTSLIKENISSELGGRALKLSLLPLSLTELSGIDRLPKTSDDWIINGSYPCLFHSHINTIEYFQKYINDLLDNEIRLRIKIHDHEKFMQLLVTIALNSGNPVNLSKLGEGVSVDARTANSWISVLEDSFIIYKLNPYLCNSSIRFVKSPKLYFYDTGLLCYLLGLSGIDVLKSYKQRENLFETAVISELLKKRYFNSGYKPKIYYWRDLDSREKEITLIEERKQGLMLTAIKNTQTIVKKDIKNILNFDPLVKERIINRQIIYDGCENFIFKDVQYRNWKLLAEAEQ